MRKYIINGIVVALSVASIGVSLGLGRVKAGFNPDAATASGNASPAVNTAKVFEGIDEVTTQKINSMIPAMSAIGAYMSETGSQFSPYSDSFFTNAGAYCVSYGKDLVANDCKTENNNIAISYRGLNELMSGCFASRQGLMQDDYSEFFTMDAEHKNFILPVTATNYSATITEIKGIGVTDGNYDGCFRFRVTADITKNGGATNSFSFELRDYNELKETEDNPVYPLVISDAYSDIIKY